MKKPSLIAALLLALAAPLAAQMPPQGLPPEAVLKDALGLTDGQIASLRDLEQARAGAAQALQPQLEERQRALNEALSASAPDPGTVGPLVISLTLLQRQFGQIAERFRGGFLDLLTDEQKSRLGFILGVESALRAAGALHQIGF